MADAVSRLQTQEAEAQAAVHALERERAALAAAIRDVRDAGTASVKAVAETAQAEVRRTAGEFAALVHDAEDLQREVAFAKALREPSAWARVDRDTWDAPL